MTFFSLINKLNNPAIVRDIPARIMGLMAELPKRSEKKFAPPRAAAI